MDGGDVTCLGKDVHREGYCRQWDVPSDDQSDTS